MLKNNTAEIHHESEQSNYQTSILCTRFGISIVAKQCICSIPFVQYFMMTHVIEILKVLDVLQKPLNFSEEWAMQFFYWSAKIGWGRIWSHCIGPGARYFTLNHQTRASFMCDNKTGVIICLLHWHWERNQQKVLLTGRCSSGGRRRPPSPHPQLSPLTQDLTVQKSG